MKPFNIEEYLRNPNRKVVTRDGRDVRIICTDANISVYHSIITLIKEPNGSETISTYTKNGKVFSSTPSANDLFFAPEKHEGWINILPYKKHICPMGCIYDSKEKAEENANIDRKCVATVKIEWNE